MAIAAIGSLVLGGIQTIGGLYGLSKMGKRERYSISPELQHSYDRAEGMSTRGYTPQETAAFKGSMASLNEQRYQRGVDMAGGSLAGAVQSGVNYGNIKSILGFAGDDAALHRRNIQYADTIGRAIQSQKNLMIQSDQSAWDRQAQAFGMAAQKGTENIVGSLNLTQALDYYKGAGADSTGGGGEKSSTAPYSWHTKADTSMQTDWMNNPYSINRTSDAFNINSPYYNDYYQFGNPNLKNIPRN